MECAGESEREQHPFLNSRDYSALNNFQHRLSLICQAFYILSPSKIEKGYVTNMCMCRLQRYVYVCVCTLGKSVRTKQSNRSYNSIKMGTSEKHCMCVETGEHRSRCLFPLIWCAIQQFITNKCFTPHSYIMHSPFTCAQYSDNCTTTTTTTTTSIRSFPHH